MIIIGGNKSEFKEFSLLGFFLNLLFDEQPNVLWEALCIGASENADPWSTIA